MAQFQLETSNISTDEGNSFWVGEFTLANPIDGQYMNIDDKFDVLLAGEAFIFVVDQKSVEKKSPESLVVRIKGVSPAVQLAAPRATPITKSWPATTALAVVTEVLGTFPFTWNILDWPLTNNLFAVTEQVPLEIVKTLVAATGGLVESLPDGSLNIRYHHGTSVPSYGPLTLTHVIDDVSDMLSVIQGSQPRKRYNRFRIMNSSTANQPDRLEFKDLGAYGVGEIRAYPNPWRTSFSLRTTRNATFLGSQNYEERPETQVVEFINSKASVSYPVLNIVSVTWLNADLGGVSFTPGATDLVSTSITDFYSLARVVYTVRSLLYTVTGVPGQQAQLLMED